MKYSITILASVLCATTLLAEIPAEKEFTNSLGMNLVRIEPGEFQMGSHDGPPTSEQQWQQYDWDEAPRHQVKITRPFYLGATEVTNAQYEAFDRKHRKMRGYASASRTNDEPVTMITWQQAMNFCKWLSEREGKPYRLPTEAEWEFACRAGTTSRFHTGDTLTVKQANIAGNKRNRTKPVASYDPNAWGLFDMHGNVEEWCLDWYGAYAAQSQTDPVGRANGYVKVTRGGSYDPASWQNENSHFCRSANRSGRLPGDANRCTGFRVVLAEMPKAKPLPVADAPGFLQNVKQTPAPQTGTDSEKPYFDDFKGRRATIPEDTWGPIFSKWNHYTACCVCPNGDVLACWYTTKSESGRELAQAGSRLRAGSDQWEPASLFFDVPDVNDHAPVLLTHGNRIYHFASQSLRGWDETTNVMRTSDDNGATWSKPRIIFRREGPHNLSQACSAFATADGTMYLAVDGSGHRMESLLVSRDAGATWNVASGDLRAACEGEYAIHPAIAPTSDGGIVCFMRGPKPMPRLVSNNEGESWEKHDTPLGGIGVGQKATALRLRSGALLLCASDTRELGGKRGTLAALSNDDGKSWSHVRHLGDVGGYMSSAQAADGVIYIFGSRQSCVAFNEAWLKEGKPIGDKSRN